MKRVALLRAVNVGGKGKVAMAQLKTVFEDAGATEVTTYIQSGNVVFDGPPALNGKRLETAIEKQLKAKITLTVRTHDQLRKVTDDCPFDDTDSVHVAFLFARPKTTDIDLASFAPEACAVRRDELYFYLPDGIGRSKLPAFVGRRVGVDMTVRNWRTVVTLREMSG